MKGDRHPTLDTALRLVQVLGDAEPPPFVARLVWIDDSASRFERALQDDPSLDAAQRAELLDRYREMRRMK